MVLENWRRITPADYEDAPEWFFKFADVLNRTLEDVVTILQAGITTKNERAKVYELEVHDSVAFDVFYGELGSNPEQIEVLWATTPVLSVDWYMSGEIKSTVTLTFVGAPTDVQTVRLKVRGS